MSRFTKTIQSLDWFSFNEFAHCFHYLSEVVVRLDASERVEIYVNHDPTDDSQDQSLLVNPREWFNEADANAFIFHADDKLNATQLTLMELKKYLPVITPTLHFRVDKLALDTQTIDHVRLVRGSERRSP